MTEDSSEYRYPNPVYYNDSLYYPATSVMNILYHRTNVKSVKPKDIYNMSRAFGIYSTHDYIDGKMRTIYSYNQVVSAFSTPEKRKSIEDYFIKEIGIQCTEIKKKIRKKKKPLSDEPVQLEFDFDRQESNRNKMLDYIHSDEVRERMYRDETDMDFVSDELLKNDDVFYESATGDSQLSDIKGKWHPREGLFKEKDPKRIAAYLLRHSKDRGQAMRRLTFYMNRAGDALSNKTVLEKAKKILGDKK